jgi:alpha-glucosidase
VIYSPLHMAADLPENYEGNPAFKFIEDVPTDWETTRIIDGKIGEFVTTVRKDRNSNDWYLGSITNETAREMEVKLDFLSPGKKYKADIYEDEKDANVETNPLPIEIRTEDVTSGTMLKLKLAAGGGTAIRFYEAK